MSNNKISKTPEGYRYTLDSDGRCLYIFDLKDDEENKSKVEAEINFLINKEGLESRISFLSLEKGIAAFTLESYSHDEVNRFVGSIASRLRAREGVIFQEEAEISDGAVLMLLVSPLVILFFLPYTYSLLTILTIFGVSSLAALLWGVKRTYRWRSLIIISMVLWVFTVVFCVDLYTVKRDLLFCQVVDKKKNQFLKNSLESYSFYCDNTLVSLHAPYPLDLFQKVEIKVREGVLGHKHLEEVRSIDNVY